jgi:3-oxoacyl-[acyl-carrier protein] reductase
MEHSVALVTHALNCAGPGATTALAEAGMHVVCHDPGFADQASCDRFRADHPGTELRSEPDVPEVVRGLLQDQGRVDAAVLNDYVASPRASLDGTTVHDYREMIEHLMIEPFRLVKALVPHMKARGSGALIFITSATVVRPQAGALTYTAARAGTTAFASALAKELAPFNIQVNSIGPIFLQSETFFPMEAWENDEQLRANIQQQVPLGRLGRQEEVGALIAFLASQRAIPITGQFIGFSGGWLP